MTLHLRMCAAGLLILSGCSGNVVLDTSGGGGLGAGGHSGGGAAGGGLTTSGATTSETFTLDTSTAEPVCSEAIVNATANAPAQLGFGPEPPQSGTYVVKGISPTLLTLVSGEGVTWDYQWAGSNLLDDFMIGDSVFVTANPGYGSYQVVDNMSTARFVATYEDHLSDVPHMNEDAPFGGPSIGFGANCAYSNSSCITAWDANATVEFVVTSIPIGETADVETFQVHNAKVTAILCDLVTTDIFLTVRGPSEGPE